MKFLSVKQVIEMQTGIIVAFGGSKGIRSKDLLESAISRMRASFDGKDLYPDIYAKAGALFESLAKNHPFIDGNKRTAFVATATFLEINGYETEFDKENTEKFILKMVSGDKTFKQTMNFLKKNSKAN